MLLRDVDDEGGVQLLDVARMRVEGEAGLEELSLKFCCALRFELDNVNKQTINRINEYK